MVKEDVRITMLEAKDLEALTGGPFYCRCGNHEYTFKPLVQKDNFFPVDLDGLSALSSSLFSSRDA